MARLDEITLGALAMTLARWEEDGILLRRRLPAAGRALLKLLTSGKDKLSLRELARRTKLSPSYLSIVRSGQQRISAGAYLALWKIAQERRELKRA